MISPGREAEGILILQIGFQMRSDYTHYHGGLGYGWIPGETFSLQNHQVGIRTQTFTDNRDNSIQSSDIALEYEFRFKSNYNGNFSLTRMYENVTDIFSFSRRYLCSSRDIQIHPV